jgi:hypothetical protein
MQQINNFKLVQHDISCTPTVLTLHDSENINTKVLNFIIEALKKDFLIFNQEEFEEKFYKIYRLSSLIAQQYHLSCDEATKIVKKAFIQLERELILKDKLELELYHHKSSSFQKTLSHFKAKYRHINVSLLEKLFTEIWYEQKN